VATQAAVMFFATTAVVEAAGGDIGQLRYLPWQTVKVLGKNPIIVGLLLGLLFNLLHIGIPLPIDTVAKSLGGAALPCAVFSVGASLSQYRVKGSLPEALSLVAIKNLLHPLLVWLMAHHLFHLDTIWTATAVLLAGSPVGVNVYLFAQRYNALVVPAAAAIVISTGASIFTLGLILYLLDVR
jgi:malonate transporter